MKQLYLLLTLIGLAIQASAQDYRPFRPGALQQYTQTVGDTTYAVRLQRQRATLSGVDSLYAFNWQVVRQQPFGIAGCLPRYAETLFGSSLKCKNPGTRRAAYVFQGLSQQGYFELRPYAPLNQPWNSFGFNCMVTSRRLGSVLGRPDSIVTIAVETGDTIRLSQHYGLVDSPSPFDWGQYPQRRPIRQLHLTALPEQALGRPLTGARAIYDFQPGDVFCYERSWSDLTSAPGYTVRHQYYGDSILTRTASRNGDTLTYSIWRYEPATGRGNQLRSVVFNNSDPMVSGPTGVLLLQRNIGIYDSRVREIAPLPGRYYGRPVLKIDGHYNYCRPNNIIDSLHVKAPPVDSEHFMAYGVGLGLLYNDEFNMYPNFTSITLIGYRKGTEQWGISCPHTMVLAARPAQAAMTVVALPNPVVADLTVRLQLRRTQSVAVRLYDTMGRLVLDQPAQFLPAGPRELTLNMVSLATGLYLLTLQPAEGAPQVLKVLKN